MPTNIGTNAAGYSAGVPTVAVAVPSYRGPADNSVTFEPLMRVSPVFTVPGSLTDGRPAGNELVQTGETVEAWGRPSIFIGGKDVTVFRGAATVITNLSWQRFGNYEAAAFVLPAVTPFDQPGTGALSWLGENAGVRIERVRPNGTRSVLWLGSVNAIRPTADGVGIEVMAHGPLYNGSYRVVTPNTRGGQAAARDDLGHQIAAALNTYRSGWSTCRPVTTGITAEKDAQFEDLTSYVRALLNLTITNAGEAYTVWLNNSRTPTIIKANSIPGRQTWTLVAGQDGVADALAKDTTAGITAVYGTGTTPGGAAWCNRQYPMASATKPRFPLDDPDGTFGQDTTDAATVPGNSITAMQTRMNALGQSVTVNGKVDDATVKAILKLQKRWGLPRNGVVDRRFWSKLYSQRDCTRGSWVAPLAITSATRKKNYNTFGRATGPNPSYNPRARKLEKTIDFGASTTLAQATRAAQAVLARDGARPIEGDLTLTVCPQEGARWDINPGDTILYKGKWGTNLSLLVHRVEWSLSNALEVRLTVSTRDMDYTQLAAEMARRNRTTLPLVTSTMASPMPFTRFPAFTPGVAASGSSATSSSTGGGIDSAKTVTGTYTLTADDEDRLLRLNSATGGSIIIPSDATSDFPVGAQVHLVQMNAAAGIWTITGASGVTVLTYPASATKLAGQYAYATLVRTGTNQWNIVGAVTA